MAMGHLVPVHAVAMLEGEDLSHGDSHREADDGHSEGVGHQVGEEPEVGQRRGEEPADTTSLIFMSSP